MSIPEAYKDRYFYHFTHLENLESICKNGLLCTNRKNAEGIDHINVANNTIQRRRGEMDVTCEPLGTVHDYVPFYWCTINPMMLSLVNTKNVDQQHVVFLAVSVDKLLQNHAIFTNASANTVEPPEFFNDVNHLDELDWDAIDSRKWSSSDDDERHRRMAEALIHQEVPFTDVDYIITWNDSYKEIAEEICKTHSDYSPTVVTSPFKKQYFYFTQFPMGRPTRSLVTGPYWLKRHFEETIDKIIQKRKENTESSFRFSNTSDLLNAIDDDFKAIPELEGIFELETVNDVHSENVSDHTLNVVSQLLESDCFKGFGNKDQKILKLAAYLHDIGKGPKSKWKDGKQPAFADHPVDALPMLERILVEDIEKLSDSKIRTICLLVAYHDLIGEIIGKGRDVEQLYNIISDERELEMLACLNKADLAAIGDFMWTMNYNLSVNKIKAQVLEKLQDND